PVEHLSEHAEDVSGFIEQDHAPLGKELNDQVARSSASLHLDLQQPVELVLPDIDDPASGEVASEHGGKLRRGLAGRALSLSDMDPPSRFQEEVEPALRRGLNREPDPV